MPAIPNPKPPAPSLFAVERFEDLPAAGRARVYGVPFARINLEDGAELFITREGWPWRWNLLPGHWHANRTYVDQGTPLPGGTGHVYRIKTRDERSKGVRKDLVIKFNRLGQHVPIYVPDFFYDEISVEEARGARFPDPFREMGYLREMRHNRYGPPGLHIRTKRPLAVFSPAERVPLWQSGRKNSEFLRLRRRLRHDQAAVADLPPVDLDIERDYLEIFEFVKGRDADYCAEEGLLSSAEVAALTRRAGAEMEAKGFRMLDIKPKHFILRRDSGGGILRRNGKIVYAVIDFELLLYTPEYREWKESKASK